MEQKDNVEQKHPDDFKDLYDRYVKRSTITCSGCQETPWLPRS